MEFENDKLWTIFVFMMIFWLLGLISGYMLGGFIHILLGGAVVVAGVRFFQRRRT